MFQTHHQTESDCYKAGCLIVLVTSLFDLDLHPNAIRQFHKLSNIVIQDLLDELHTRFIVGKAESMYCIGSAAENNVMRVVMCCLCRMAVDSAHKDSACDWHGRWSHVRKFLERPGPFTHPDFEPSTEVTIPKMCIVYAHSKGFLTVGSITCGF